MQRPGPERTHGKLQSSLRIAVPENSGHGLYAFALGAPGVRTRPKLTLELAGTHG